MHGRLVRADRLCMHAKLYCLCNPIELSSVQDATIVGSAGNLGIFYHFCIKGRKTLQAIEYKNQPKATLKIQLRATVASQFYCLSSNAFDSVRIIDDQTGCSARARRRHGPPGSAGPSSIYKEEKNPFFRKKKKNRNIALAVGAWRPLHRRSRAG